MSILQDLWNRRVPHVVGIYLGVSWALLEFVGFLVDRYLLSPHIVTFSLIVLVSLLPSIFIIAHFHGTPGRQGWTRVEKVVVPSNLLALAVLLVLVFSGKDLGATTTTTAVTDEEGTTTERLVPKRAFRKRLAVFFLDNPGEDGSIAWLQLGIPWALVRDLRQDLFLSVQQPVGFAERLREEGFPDGLGMPLALMRSIARDGNREWFLTGSLSRSDSQLLVTTRLYDSERGRLARERSFAGSDLFALVDEISVQLRLDLDAPSAEMEETPDVPVSDLLTGSAEAYRSLVEGERAVLLQDWQTATQHLDQAVVTDPLFAFAHLERFSAYLALNDHETASAAIERALELDYRLSESDRLAAKAAYYRLVRQNAARALAVMRMRTELYPDDVEARLGLAVLHSDEGRFDSAAVHYERALEIDPGQHDLLVALGVLAGRQGRFEESLAYYQRYAARFPERASGHVAVGAAYRALGRHAESLEAFERALLLDHNDPQALLGSGAALAAVGRLDETLDRFHEALDVSQTATQRAEVYRLLEEYHQGRGEMAQAVKYMHKRWTELAEGGPFYQLQLKLQGLGTYVRAGRSAAAFDSLESFARQLPSGFQTMLPLGYAGVYLEMEDAEGLEGTVPGLEEFMEQLGAGALNSFVEVVRGKVLELRGDCGAALPHYEESLRLDATELDGYLHLARCHRALGDLEAAEQSAREYLRFRPYHPRGHYELALALRDAGRRREAIEQARLGADVLANADSGFPLAADLKELLESLQTQSSTR